MGWFFLFPHFTFYLFLLLTHFPSHTYTLCNHHDTSALLQFKNSSFLISSTSYYYDECDSSSFTSKTESWKNGTDCCEWDGVTCNNLSGRVIGLELSCGHLKGELYPNSTIFKLRHLQQLNLAFNFFVNSSIHSGVGDLVSLTHLNLSYSGIVGDIPPEISHLSKLVSLSLGNYRGWIEVYEASNLSMSLDPSTWKKLILNATNLREIHLGAVNMSSIKVSSLSLLMNLSSSLVSLTLAGTIPQSLSNLINLEWLDLSRNKLMGEIPVALTNLTSLSTLNLSQNQLEGLIPTGKQFNTFGNDSYEGNPLLCGFPLSKSCKNDEEKPPYSTVEDEEDSGFGWKAVVIGYACGAVFGVLIGYNVLSTGKPRWLARLVESMFNTTLRKANKRVCGNRRRMN